MQAIARRDEEKAMSDRINAELRRGAGYDGSQKGTIDYEDEDDDEDEEEDERCKFWVQV